MSPGAQSVRRAVRLPDDGAELLGFCLRHADGGLDAATRERLLTRLVSGPDSVVDLFQEGERVLVAVVLDTLAEPADAVVAETLGCAEVRDWAAAAAAVLDAAERAARAGGRSRVECIWRHPTAPGLAEVLETRGYRLDSIDFRMERPPGPLPPVDPLPPGWRWREVDEALFPVYHRLRTAAFADAGLPLYVPPAAELAAALLGARLRPRLLLDGERALGFLRVEHTPGDPDGEIGQIGRDPALRGRGLGPRLLAEALRLLGADGAERFRLGVTARNRSALALYQRFGFAVLHESGTYSRSLDPG